MSETDRQTVQDRGSHDPEGAAGAATGRGMPGTASKPGRPPHPVAMEQHSVAMPPDLWTWLRETPEGPGALIRDLLERERTRRTSPHYEGHMAGGPGYLHVATPLGPVTALEYPGRGVILLRGDDQAHVLTYAAQGDRWYYILPEDSMHDLLRPPHA